MALSIGTVKGMNILLVELIQYFQKIMLKQYIINYFPSDITFPVYGYQDSMNDTGKCIIGGFKNLNKTMEINIGAYSNNATNGWTIGYRKDNTFSGSERTSNMESLSSTPYTFTYYYGTI